MTDLQYIDGLYVGMLDEREMRVFEDAIKRGEAKRWYEGVGGFMGLAKVRLVPDESGSPDGLV